MREERGTLHGAWTEILRHLSPGVHLQEVRPLAFSKWPH